MNFIDYFLNTVVSSKWSQHLTPDDLQLRLSQIKRSILDHDIDVPESRMYWEQQLAREIDAKNHEEVFRLLDLFSANFGKSIGYGYDNSQSLLLHVFKTWDDPSKIKGIANRYFSHQEIIQVLGNEMDDFLFSAVYDSNSEVASKHVEQFDKIQVLNQWFLLNPNHDPSEFKGLLIEKMAAHASKELFELVLKAYPETWKQSLPLLYKTSTLNHQAFKAIFLNLSSEQWDELLQPYQKSFLCPAEQNLSIEHFIRHELDKYQHRKDAHHFFSDLISKPDFFNKSSLTPEEEGVLEEKMKAQQDITELVLNHQCFMDSAYKNHLVFDALFLVFQNFYQRPTPYFFKLFEEWTRHEFHRDDGKAVGTQEWFIFFLEITLWMQNKRMFDFIHPRVTHLTPVDQERCAHLLLAREMDTTSEEEQHHYWTVLLDDPKHPWDFKKNAWKDLALKAIMNGSFKSILYFASRRPIWFETEWPKEAVKKKEWLQALVRAKLLNPKDVAYSRAMDVLLPPIYAKMGPFNPEEKPSLNFFEKTQTKMVPFFSKLIQWAGTDFDVLKKEQNIAYKKQIQSVVEFLDSIHKTSYYARQEGAFSDVIKPFEAALSEQQWALLMKKSDVHYFFTADHLSDIEKKSLHDVIHHVPLKPPLIECMPNDTPSKIKKIKSL